jgi:hypothetical protein
MAGLLARWPPACCEIAVRTGWGQARTGGAGASSCAGSPERPGVCSGGVRGKAGGSPVGAARRGQDDRDSPPR